MIDLGDDFGPEGSTAPSAEAIDAYTEAWDMRESIFRDAEYAVSLGFRGRVVPGPMMTARIEHFLRRALPEWEIERLSTTFRLPTIAGEPVAFHGTVTEVHATARGTRLVCDVFVENSEGERSVIGVATFHHQGSDEGEPQ